MELVHEFTFDLPVADAWALLTDIERVAPCMPGAELQSISDGEFHGTVKVKVGPISAAYGGTAVFVERSADARRAVLRAEARELRGNGKAGVTTTMQLSEVPDGTHVSLRSELTISGRVAQFGRGMIAEVSRSLLDEFVESLRQTGVQSHAGGGARVIEAARSEDRTAVAAEPVSVLRLVAVPVLKRVAVGLACVCVLVWLLATLA